MTGYDWFCTIVASVTLCSLPFLWWWGKIDGRMRKGLGSMNSNAEALALLAGVPGKDSDEPTCPYCGNLGPEYRAIAEAAEPVAASALDDEAWVEQIMVLQAALAALRARLEGQT